MLKGVAKTRNSVLVSILASSFLLLDGSNANQDIDIGSYGIYAGLVNADLADFVDIQITSPGHYPAVGHIAGTSGGDFNITSQIIGDFVGFSAGDGNAYFGANPYNTGYGVQYGGGGYHILYVTRDAGGGDAGALSFQNTGGASFYGNSANYTIPVTIDDSNSLDDGNAYSFAVQISGAGKSAYLIRNNGDVLWRGGLSYLLWNGSGQLNGLLGFDTLGGLSAGSSAPVYAQLESFSTGRSQLLLGRDLTYYTIFNQSTTGLILQPSFNSTLGFQFKNQAGSAIYTIDTTNQLHYFALGANTVLFAKGASNITPNISIAASGGKAIADGAGTTGAYTAYDSTGTYTIGTDTRANIVGGTTSSLTQRIGITSAGLTMVGLGTATSRLHITESTAGANVLTIANSDATFGNSYTIRISNGTGAPQKAMRIDGGGSSNDAIHFEDTMCVGMGSTTSVAIGTQTYTAKLGVLSTTEQLRLQYDASNYYSTTVSSAGAVTFDAVGSSAGFTFNDSITLVNGLFVGSSSANQIYNASSAATVIDYNVNASSTANNTFIRLGNGTLSSASSGVSNVISSTPSINQSGTAGYNALNINVTETATGSGAKNLALLAVGGVEKFKINNAGNVILSAPLRLKGYTVATLPAGVQGDKAFVTDALAPTYLVAVVAGGAVVTEVFYNGTNWVCT